MFGIWQVCLHILDINLAGSFQILMSDFNAQIFENDDLIYMCA